MATFGEELRRERELREISLREISESTKINIRFLQALESNDFTHLPGGQFTKGFVRAYAHHIGVDGEAMVNAYLYELERQHRDAQHRGSAVGLSKLDLAGPSGAPAPRRTWILVAGTLTLAAILTVLLLVWPGWLREQATPDAAAQPVPSGDAS